VPHAGRLLPGAIVLPRTGWDTRRESDAYFDPRTSTATPATRSWRVAHVPSGSDAINLDATPRDELDRARFRCHARIKRGGRSHRREPRGPGRGRLRGPANQRPAAQPARRRRWATTPAGWSR
jgi:hypothetical protein